MYGLNGITNSGNTCYVNSILQCLSNIPTLKSIFLTENLTVCQNSKTNGELVKSFTEFLKAMWTSSNVVLNSRGIQLSLLNHTKKFDSHHQQDAQEFLLHLLAGLNDELKLVHQNVEIDRGGQYGSFSAISSWKKFQASESSILSDIFVSQMKSSIECLSCKKSHPTYEIFWELSLPIPNEHGTIYDCLDKFFSPETLEDGNQPRCMHCEKQSGLLKCYKAQKLPLVLILCLKRFSSNILRKSTCNVCFPLASLDMTDYVTMSSKFYESNFLYDLVAVSNHIGQNVFYGHYTAYCKNSVNGKWYLFDDDSVSEVEPHKVNYSNLGYILIYEKKRTN